MGRSTRSSAWNGVARPRSCSSRRAQTSSTASRRCRTRSIQPSLLSSNRGCPRRYRPPQGSKDLRHLPQTRDGSPLRGEARLPHGSYGLARRSPMRHMARHLRRFLAHHAFRPRVGAKVVKAGLVKVAGGASVALVIPIAAVGTYAIPASTIEHIAAPIAGAAPNIFDVHGLAQFGRTRLRAALERTRPIRRALDSAAGVFDSGNNSSSSTAAPLAPVGVALPVSNTGFVAVGNPTGDVGAQPGETPPAVDPPAQPPADVSGPGGPASTGDDSSAGSTGGDTAPAPDPPAPADGGSQGGQDQGGSPPDSGGNQGSDQQSGDNGQSQSGQ